MPEIMNTDFLFEAAPADVGESVPALRTGLRLQVVPNPFNPAARVRFSLPLAGSTTVTIYDAAGRLVADLLRAEMPPGDHEVFWDGADLGGRAAPSGIYLVRVRTAHEQIVGKITLVQ